VELGDARKRKAARSERFPTEWTIYSGEDEESPVHPPASPGAALETRSSSQDRPDRGAGTSGTEVKP